MYVIYFNSLFRSMTLTGEVCPTMRSSKLAAAGFSILDRFCLTVNESQRGQDLLCLDIDKKFYQDDEQ